MKKKLKDCTINELQQICANTKRCDECQLFLEDDFYENNSECIFQDNTLANLDKYFDLEIESEDKEADK